MMWTTFSAKLHLISGLGHAMHKSNTAAIHKYISFFFMHSVFLLANFMDTFTLQGQAVAVRNYWSHMQWAVFRVMHV